MSSRIVSSSIVLSLAVIPVLARAQAAPATPPAPVAPSAASTDPAPPPVETTPPPDAATTPAAAPIAPAATRTLDAAEIEHLVDERLAAQPPTAGWKDGFFVQTPDGKTKLKIGGFTQFDGRFFVDDSKDPKIDQFGFRSIRPDLQGTLFDHVDFRLLPDFAGAKLVLQDVYVDVRYADAIKVRFGKFKVPFGLERLQSETNTVFVERGLPTQLAPNRDLGVQVFGELAAGVLSYQLGVWNGVADGASGDGDVSNGKEIAARVFVQPFASAGGIAKNLGVGGAVTYGNKNGTLASPDLPQWKTQGQSTFFGYKSGTTLADTVIADGAQWRATGQADYFTGPIGVLAEYVRSVQRAALGDTAGHVTADAWQLAAQWVVTGDDATYKSVAPRHPFDPAKGDWGAFDVAARVGQISLDDNAFADGLADSMKSSQKATSFGGGVDWFASKNLRLVVDVERTTFKLGAKTGDRPDETSIVGRVQTIF